MRKRIASKLIWVGRATTFLIGLVVVVALILGTAATALAGTGVGAPFHLGKANTVNAISKLVGSVSGASLVIENSSTNPRATTLDLRVEAGQPPLKVNSNERVAKLNADLLDGKDASALEDPRGYAHVSPLGVVTQATGVEGVSVPEIDGENSLYCFNLTFTPTLAIGSPHLNNSAVVATTTSSNAAVAACPTDHRDAAAKTYGSSDGSAAPINFSIIFV